MSEEASTQSNSPKRDSRPESEICRTAIVFVHGQGDQAPLDGARNLAYSVFETDPDFEIADKSENLWGIPDEDGDDLDLRKLTSATATATNEEDKHSHRFDFFELYWANEIVSTPFDAFRAWFEGLIKRDPHDSPARLLPLRQLLIRAFEMVFIFALVGMLYALALQGETQNRFEFVLFLVPCLIGFCVGYDRTRTRQREVCAKQTAFAETQAVPPNWLGMLPLFAVFTSLLIWTFLTVQFADVDHWKTAVWSAIAISFSAFIARQLTLAALTSLAGFLLCIVANALYFSSGESAELFGVSLIDVMFAVVTGLLSLAVAASMPRSEWGYVSRWLIIFAIGLAGWSLSIWGVPDGAGQPYADIQVDKKRLVTLPAAWVIAAVIMQTLAARFNGGGVRHVLHPVAAKVADDKFRYQVGYYLIILGLPIILAAVSAYSMNGFSLYVWAVAIIMIGYAMTWLLVTGYIKLPDGSGASSEPSPQTPMRLKPSRKVLGVELVSFFIWAVFYLEVMRVGDENTTHIVDDSALVWLGAFFLAILPLVGVAAYFAQKTFLAPVMGDSATYFSAVPRNIEARRRIRKRGVELLERLHATDYYGRIIVVAHSLGSVVAYDVLSQYWAQQKFAEIPKGKGGGNGTDLIDRLNCVRAAADEVQSTAPKPDCLNAVTPGAHAKYDDAVVSFQKKQRQLQLDFMEWCLKKSERRRQGDCGESHEAEANAPSGNEELEHGDVWRISDFVTLGSPLTYASLLMSNSRYEFERRLQMRELPTCPPRIDKSSDIPYTYEKYVGNRPYTLLNHGALFAMTRWTNLYFETPGLITGDIIGGPIDDKLGLGVRNMEIRNWWDSFETCDYQDKPYQKIQFAHNQYWVWPKVQGSREPVWAISTKCTSNSTHECFDYIRHLREALHLNEGSVEETRIQTKISQRYTSPGV